ncbi:MAG: two-component system, OmpR family, sensor kinase [Acidobacteriota bacterium]|jgi:heavy metal sensor kinase|nr:two-component system, OmpR family, sensor kinase [Acidobacteriota bacterium]
MFSSVRARLTLWYTGVLALVLITFALAGYFFLSRTLNRRTDDALGEVADAFAATLVDDERDSQGRGEANATRGEDGSSSPDEAVIEAISQNQFRDYQFVVYDDTKREVAASPIFPAKHERTNTPVWKLQPVATQIAGVLDAVARTPEAALYFATLSDSDNQYRVVGRRVQTRGSAYMLVVLRSLHDQEDLLERTSYALLIAVPLALLLASIGGYFLARKSLAPVVRMSQIAARIGAANLHERLPVVNEQDELGGLALVINALLARLNASFEQQRRFMADASHELRTPVAIMRSETEVALSQQERSNEDLRESLAIVKDETGRLTRIVEDLFTLARADAGQYKLTSKEFYLDELAAEVARSVRTLVAERELTLQLDATQEMPFHGDENLLRRLLLNLLDNTIKHTPRGGAVTISCQHTGEQYVITVSDTGTGIPTEAQPHIFDRFYRADSARSRADDDNASLTSGAGLGLSIARWVAEAHAGTLELLHSSEAGSVFQLILPAPGRAH